MNILDAEDMIKGLPDQTLMQQAQMPTGELPQFLVISEIQRRSDMRKRHEAQMQEQSQGTVKDQIMREGIAAMMPQQPMGMPPQMMPQGMPPQGMPPQGMPTGMPPMGMAAGGVVRMQNMGQVPAENVMRLRSILASNPGISFVDLMRMGFTQDDVNRLSNMGYQERMSAERILGDATSGLERIDPEMRLSKTIPTEVRPASDIYSQSAVTEFAEDFSKNMQANMPQYSMVSPASDDIIGPALTSLDETVSSGIGGIMRSIPQYSIPDPNSPSSAFSRSAGELMQQSLDESAGRRQGIVDFLTGKYRYQPESIALLEAEEAGDISRAERKLALSGDSAGGAEVQGAGSNVQSAGRASPDILGLGSYQDELLGYKGDFPYRPGRTPDDMERIQALIAANDRRSEELLGAPAVDGPKPGVESADPVSTLLSAASSVQTDSSDPLNRRRSMIDDPVLDLSDIIAQSEKMAQANALMQLGAGIAEGNVAKGISAAGIAATKGMQDARALEMKKRLAEYQAGREDIRRGEEAERFERQMTLQERKVDISADQFDRTLAQAGEKIKADIDKGVRVSKGQLLNYIADVLKESGRDLIPQEGQTRQDMLTALQNQLLSQFGPFLDVDVSELVASGAGAAGGMRSGDRPPLSSFGG